MTQDYYGTKRVEAWPGTPRLAAQTAKIARTMTATSTAVVRSTAELHGEA